MPCMAFTSPSFAQMDPTLTAMILEYTQKAKSQYNTQLETMAVETEGHVWLKQEVEATKNYQQQFDRYISTFRGILSYAAQVYGFYYEVNHLTENMGRLSRQIGDTPVNAVAVALHHNRNDIYVDIINRSIDRHKNDGETAHRTCVFHTSATSTDEQKTCHAHQTGALHNNGTGVVRDRISVAPTQGG